MLGVAVFLSVPATKRHRVARLLMASSLSVMTALGLVESILHIAGRRPSIYPIDTNTSLDRPGGFRRLFPDQLHRRSATRDDGSRYHPLRMRLPLCRGLAGYVGPVRRVFASLHTIFRFSDLMAGDIPTFGTLQQYYDTQMPSWFWNVGEFVAAVRERGYKLIFRSIHMSTILGATGPLPMTNSPLSHRVDHGCHLLFAPTR